MPCLGPRRRRRRRRRRGLMRERRGEERRGEVGFISLPPLQLTIFLNAFVLGGGGGHPLRIVFSVPLL